MAKKKKESYGNYIINNKDELLKKKKQRIVMKRTFIILVMLIAVLTTLAFTLPVFNLQKITISGNSTVTEEEINDLSGVVMDTNIFKLNMRNIADNIKKNPYIESVKVRRSYPSGIQINIKERTRAFYVSTDNGVYIVDHSGYVLQKEDELDDPLLLRLTGLSEEDLVVGEKIHKMSEDNLKSIAMIYDFLTINNLFESYGISTLEINNYVTLKLYVNKLYIKLGTMDDLYNKLSKAFNIVRNEDVINMTGYVDVSFDGNPVIFREQTEE